MANNVNVVVSGASSTDSQYRTYNTVILKQNIVDGKNILTQDMVNEENTIYVVKWDYTLSGNTVIIRNCVIDFSGGTISDGELICNRCILSSNISYEYMNNVIITGDYIDDTLNNIHEHIKIVEIDISDRYTKQETDDAIHSSVESESERAQSVEGTKANSEDVYTKEETYNKTELNSLITTPNVSYVSVSNFGDLPEIGSPDTIYRVASYNGSASSVDSSKYSEYAWDGSNYVLLSVKQQIQEALTGYYTCVTSASTSAKTVSAPNYTLTGGGSIKINFQYSNTASSPTLNINSQGAKAIVFNGAAASASNTWGAGEVVEFYYDPSYNSNAGGYIGRSTVVSVSQNTLFIGDRPAQGFLANRYKGMTGTSSAFVQEVNIPAGSIVKNVGTGPVMLHAAKSSSSAHISLLGGEMKLTTFDITWIKGRGTTSKPYDIYVYFDGQLLSRLLDSVIQEPSVNLINTLDADYILDRQISSDGTITTSSITDVSGFISVKANTEYLYSALGSISTGAYIAFYDASKTFLSNLEFAANAIMQVLTTPADCAYVRLSIAKTAVNPVLALGVKRGMSAKYDPTGAYIKKGGYGEDSLLSMLTMDSNAVTAYNLRTENKFAAGNSSQTDSNMDIVEYGPFVVGDTVRINMTDAILSVRACSNYNFTGTYNTVDGEYCGSYLIHKIVTGYTYIKMTVRHGVTPSASVIKAMKDTVNRNTQELQYGAVNATFFRIDSGMKLTSGSWISSNDSTDVLSYGPFKAGEVVEGSLEQTNVTYIAKLFENENYSAGSTVDKTSSVNPDGSFSITIQDGYPYLRLCVDTNTVPTVFTLKSLKEQVEDLTEGYYEVKSLKQCESLCGSDAAYSIGSLSDGDNIILSDFPLHCRKGLAMSFYGDITTFDKLYIGKGYQTYRGRWIEIDDTTITFKGCESTGSETTLDSAAHGLTISTFIDISLALNYEGKCKVSIMTLTGQFSHVFDWGYEGNYSAFAKSVGSTLTNCRLSATSTDFKLPVWIIGDSYMGVNNNRWPGQLKNIGYFNYLIDNLAGINSTNSYNDFLRLLNFGTPKYLVWMSVANDYSNIQTAISNANKVANICDERAIELLLMTLGSMPERNFSVWNTYVRNSGRRFVDFEKAVGMPEYDEGVDNWYGAGTQYAYLSSDGVHPTEIGAKALAQRLLADFPELMQYGLYKDDTSLDDTNNDH